MFGIFNRPKPTPARVSPVRAAGPARQAADRNTRGFASSSTRYRNDSPTTLDFGDSGPTSSDSCTDSGSCGDGCGGGD